ncbi:hypothetical protein [Cohnella algarum]|uniref:hypothetical protein n=1 Tax=Cohnella algarum TaxID=2044859 RepID=UPI0019670703|nr:hypothetical protein [Cohnella algarum]MBN2980128.1 hypothetical protein [Cohnella algarum]
MTLPVVPMELMPWVYFGKGTVHIKPDAPEEFLPAYEKFRELIEKQTREKLQLPKP